MAIYIYIVYNNFSYVLTNNNYIHICYKLFINFRYIPTNNSYIQYIVHLLISNEFQKIIAIYIYIAHVLISIFLFQQMKVFCVCSCLTDMPS